MIVKHKGCSACPLMINDECGNEYCGHPKGDFKDVWLSKANSKDSNIVDIETGVPLFCPLLKEDITISLSR